MRELRQFYISSLKKKKQKKEEKSMPQEARNFYASNFNKFEVGMPK